jgi:uncharacterized protein YukE
MADISVDLDALDSFGNRLDNIKHALDSSHHTIDSYENDYGSNKVRDAMHHFEKHWRDGRKHVEDTADTLASMAHESVKAFRKADADLKKSLEDGTKGKAQ